MNRFLVEEMYEKLEELSVRGIHAQTVWYGRYCSVCFRGSVEAPMSDDERLLLANSPQELVFVVDTIERFDKNWADAKNRIAVRN